REKEKSQSDPSERPTMSKIVGATSIILVLAVLGVAIASLVFNILIFNQRNSESCECTSTSLSTLSTTLSSSSSIATTSTSTSSVSTTTESPSPTPFDDGECPSFNNVSTDANWKEAADRILATADFSVDPCEDFYQFSCGKYLQNTDLEGMSRKGTYDEAQYQINL
ncbi:hypothetical protein PMAYCL1PPCAC_02104, partial [Pristionchus mayeri]